MAYGPPMVPIKALEVISVKEAHPLRDLQSAQPTRKFNRPRPSSTEAVRKAL